MNLRERAGKAATYLWVLGVAAVVVAWINDPSIFTQERMAAWMDTWGDWAFGGFVAVALFRGLFLVPSTPIVLAGGVLFPHVPVVVFALSMVGIVLSASVIYLLPGFGGYDELLERRYPERIARLKVRLGKPQAFWVVAGWSFFPFVPTDVICYVAGLVQMSYRRMILAVMLGEIPLVIGYVVLTLRAQALLG